MKSYLQIKNIYHRFPCDGFFFFIFLMFYKQKIEELFKKSTCTISNTEFNVLKFSEFSHLSLCVVKKKATKFQNEMTCLKFPGI